MTRSVLVHVILLFSLKETIAKQISYLNSKYLSYRNTAGKPWFSILPVFSMAEKISMALLKTKRQDVLSLTPAMITLKDTTFTDLE